MNDSDEILAVKAAELYYEAGKTQEELGRVEQELRKPHRLSIPGGSA